MTLPDWLVPLARAAADIRPEELSRFTPPGEGERASAVLILLGEGPDGPDVLIIRRSDALRNHAGQAAFPGGSLDPGESATEAALREAVEETGLDPTGVDVLAVLPELFIPFSGFAVTPVLGWWRQPSAVGPVDLGEVADVVRVPLRALGTPETRVAVAHPSGWTGPGFVLPGMLVWGFTAGLLTRLLELGGLIPAVDLDSLPLVDLPSATAPTPSGAGA